MNTGTEKLALGRGPQTFVSPRTSGAPLALRLNTFARPASAPVAVLRSRSVADLDLRALQAFVETPPEVTDAESAAIFDEPRAPPISRLDQPPRMTTRAAPDVPPVSRATELSAPVTQAWPAAVADEVPRLTVESPIYPSTEALALPETRARPSAAAPPMFVAPRSPLPARVDDPVKTASTPVTPPPGTAARKITVPESHTAPVEAPAPRLRELPMPARTNAAGDFTPAPAGEARIAPHHVVVGEHIERKPAAPLMPIAAKPMGTPQPARSDDGQKFPSQPAPATAVLSKLRDVQRARQQETVRIGTVQVVVRPNAAPAPAPAAPMAPPARTSTAPAGSAFRNVWLSRRRYE